MDLKTLSAEEALGRLHSDTFGPEPILRRLFQARSQADYEIRKFELDAAQLAGMIEEAELFSSRIRNFVSDSLAKGPDEGE